MASHANLNSNIQMWEPSRPMDLRAVVGAFLENLVTTALISAAPIRPGPVGSGKGRLAPRGGRQSRQDLANGNNNNPNNRLNNSSPGGSTIGAAANIWNLHTLREGGAIC